jgi:hypothetical protein
VREDSELRNAPEDFLAMTGGSTRLRLGGVLIANALAKNAKAFSIRLQQQPAALAPFAALAEPCIAVAWRTEARR